MPLEASREERTIAQLAQKYGIHPTLIRAWKRQLLDHAKDAFGRGLNQDDSAATPAELYPQIGPLKAERNF